MQLFYFIMQLLLRKGYSVLYVKNISFNNLYRDKGSCTRTTPPNSFSFLRWRKQLLFSECATMASGSEVGRGSATYGLHEKMFGLYC